MQHDDEQVQQNDQADQKRRIGWDLLDAREDGPTELERQNQKIEDDFVRVMWGVAFLTVAIFFIGWMLDK